MKYLNRVVLASAMLLAIGLLSPSSARATDQEPKKGLKFYIPGTLDFYCQIETCCVGWPDCQWGPSCCSVS